MKQKSSPKRVLSVAKQKVQTAVQQIKQRVARQRAENLYERLIGIKPTKKIVVSPKQVRRSIRRLSRRASRRLSGLSSPVSSQMASPIVNVTSPKRRTVQRKSVKKM
jgi:hypothetical protein